jgi:hypothetical protein
MATYDKCWNKSQLALFRFLDEVYTDKTLPGAGERFEQLLNELVMAQIALYFSGWRPGDPVPNVIYEE